MTGAMRQTLTLILGLAVVTPAAPQAGVAPLPPQGGVRSMPRLEPVAETRLIMVGINLPNFQALEKLLQQRPGDADAWVFARGQALLIAEAGNLLLLRPPRNGGEGRWMDDAVDLRVYAARLARSLADRDYAGSRRQLTELATRCNRCHGDFRVNVRITPFAAGGVPGVPAPPAPPTVPQPKPPPPAKQPPGS